MAVVAPFRALRYNKEKKPDLSKVVTPPYDVINSRQQDEFYSADPNNVIRLELNRERESDTSEDNRYTRAAAHLQNWLEQGVLVRDSKPAFYLNETSYTDADGNPRTRTGFMTALRLEDFDAGVVLPHEKTFTGHKEDRLALYKKVKANVSPIFALYPDDDNQVRNALAAAKSAEPVADFIDPAGLRQRMYAVDDPAACAKVIELMADKVIFIADGHHRYETGLNYRNYMREKYPDAPADAAFNYTMTYLCSMSDPGLTVFACHRVLPNLAGFDSRDFLALSAPYFDLKTVPCQGDPEQDKARLTEALAKEGENGPSFGLVSLGDNACHVLTLKPGVMEQEPWSGEAEALRALDVVVLTNVVLDHILGLDNSARDHVHTIKYVSDMAQVLSEVAEGESRVAFLLNPTLVEQVKAVAESRLIMPRKSTYFYPKVLTGLTINPLGHDETV